MVADEQIAHETLRKSGSLRTYAVVWALLMLLTGITVTAAELDLGKIAIVICLAIAGIKSILVLLYFMHLRHEERLVIKLAIPIALTALALFIGITFTDVIAR
jgi:cytochrome c oxidase subunit IV